MSIWTTPLNELSPIEIILSKWVPSLITILIGGLVASVLIPRWQSANARHHAREARKLELLEQFSQNCSRYLVSLNRLYTISKAETLQPLNEKETARKDGFVADRNRYRESIHDNICSLSIYFETDTEDLLKEFILWDRNAVNLPIDQAPLIIEWSQRIDSIVAHLRRKVSAK